MPFWKSSLLSTANAILPYGLTKTQLIRVFKATLGSLLCFTFCIIPAVEKHLGNAEYLLSLIAVSMNGGRRVGAMIEVCVLALSGLAIGLAYAAFGRYFAILIDSHTNDLTKSLAFLAVMETIILLFIGFLKSSSPRLFIFGFLVFLVVHFSFLSSLDTSMSEWAKSFSLPLLFGIGICLFINLTIYPEFGSTALGTTVIDGLNEIHKHINSTVDYFINFKQAESEKRLFNLQKERSAIRKKVALSKSVLTESTFEMTYSYMAPQELKPTVKLLSQISASTSAIVGACELEFALLGDDKDKTDDDITKEIAHADADILINFLNNISEPVLALSSAISVSFNCIKLALSYGYDVPDELVKLINEDSDNSNDVDTVSFKESRQFRDKITIEAIDKALQFLVLTITKYDSSIPKQLERAAIFESNQNNDTLNSDNIDAKILLPRDEYFLVSSFLLNFREVANIASNLLSNSREIVEHRSHRESKGFFGRSLWFFSISSKKILRKYLWTGDDIKEVDIASIHTKTRSIRENQSSGPSKGDQNIFNRARNILADIIEFPTRYSFHCKYAFKYTVLLMLVSFPAFSASMRNWYVDIKGTWVGFVANLVLESSVGTTVTLFVIRTVGLVIGSAWGYAAYEAGWSGTTPGGYVVMCTVLTIGLVIGYYFMIASPYPKAALIGIVSSTIVILSTIYPIVPSTIRENFAKRCIAMLIGGAAGVLVQLILFPVKARVELVNQIVACLEYCERLELIIAQGIEGKSSSYMSTQESYTQLEKLWKKAGKCLALAESYRKQAKQEPRLKGSFRHLDKVFDEIIFALHQIIDKFHNIAFLRRKYGSAILDDLSPYVFSYRREVYGCLTTTFRAIEVALQTKEPLPQFLPSARIAHLRVINRVREVLVTENVAPTRDVSRQGSVHEDELEIRPLTESEKKNSMLRQTYMAWSATSSALEEIIEYVEELVNLTRLLIGVNNFRYGFLSRPLNIESDDNEMKENSTESRDGKRPASVSTPDKEHEDTVADLRQLPATLRRRKFSAFDSIGGGAISQTLPISDDYISRTLSQIEQDYGTALTTGEGTRRFSRSHSASSGGDETLPLSLKRVVTGHRRRGK